MQKIRDIFDFKNKHAIVVGGSGYIGCEIVKALVEINCNVTVLDQKKIILKNKKVKYINFNIGTHLDYEKKFLKILKKSKRVNFFINASYPKTSSWDKCSFLMKSNKIITENINLHLNSFLELSKIISDYFKKNRIKGNIVNLSSIYGIVAQDKQLYQGTNMSESIPYPVIKGGINMMTKQFASYYGSYGIRINTVCPGGVIDKKYRKNYPSIFIKNYEKKVPMKRFATPREVALSTVFLLSDASSYITGVNLPLDGGWTIT